MTDGRQPDFGTRLTALDSAFDSAVMYKGAVDEGTLTRMRERAIYDNESLVYKPVASTGKGPIFPGAIEALVAAEDDLRAQTTTFRGPQQLFISHASQ